MAAAADFHRHGGEWPPGETRSWEPQSSIRRRAVRALHRQAAGDEPFIAVCHGMVIESLTGDRGIEYCGVRLIDLENVVKGEANSGSAFLPTRSR
jgi:hypothetical protein